MISQKVTAITGVIRGTCSFLLGKIKYAKRR
jgi:homoserine dehydrogenase